MKKLLVTLIVPLVFIGSIFAQHPETHWPGFYYPAYESQSPLYASIMIDGVPVTTDYPDWDVLEVAAFVGEQLRMTSMYLTDEYLEYDLFPTLNAEPIYYTTPGEEVTFKMYNHNTGVVYEVCEPVIWDGDPITILTGEDHWEGFDDPDHPLMLNFTTPASDCKIRVPWYENFEDMAEGITTPLTGVEPECWTLVAQYTSPAEGSDTLAQPQLYYKPEFNATEGGSYSLRMMFRCAYAMPELDESVDFGNLKMSMYVRQPFWSYKLQIGVMTDLEDESTFTPVAIVNNSTKAVTYYECNFASVKNITGPGRYIVFKNIGGTDGDIYCSNYLDDITLTYLEEECGITFNSLPYTENFEGYTELLGETNVEPDCWEVISEDAVLESVSKPQLYSNFNTTEGGDYTLRMKNRCVYAMPVLSGLNVAELTMTLNVRQPNSLYRLQVGVVDEEGEFTPVQTIKCTSTEMEPFTVNFNNIELPQATPTETAPEYRIAFRNTLAPGVGMSVDYLDYSYNYIDDIVLSYNYVSHGVRMEESVNGMDVNSVLENIEVYPNPTKGELYIDAMGIQKVECYNQMGQLVRVYDNVLNTIDLNNLSEGVYMLRITVPQGVTMRKVVKR